MIDSEGPDQLIDSLTEEMASHTLATDVPSPQDTVELEPTQAIRLWQLFVVRVDPLTKIIHVPTVQEYLPQAITAMHTLPYNYQALFHAIFGMATLSLSAEECQAFFGETRYQALKRPALAMQRALREHDFVKNYDNVVLQALTFSLVRLARG